MSFKSILVGEIDPDVQKEAIEPPGYFVDLNLDQVIDRITSGRDEYNLKPFYYTPLSSLATIKYRHEIMVDLENGEWFESITSFSKKMIRMREHFTREEKLNYTLQKESWFLDAVEIYCEAVECLTNEISRIDLKSKGFASFREYLKNYIDSTEFKALFAETKEIKNSLFGLCYCFEIKGSSITVRNCESEPDYSQDVERTFEKFKQGSVNDYRVAFRPDPDMNHVEAKVLEFVAELNKEIFMRLHDYNIKNKNFIDPTLKLFDREIQFYIAFLEYCQTFKRNGLNFCYPEVSNELKEEVAQETFDQALAYKLGRENSQVVCNDFSLQGSERIFVISGPNQGGKTTFARTFGQIHYFASLGCKVPGIKTKVFLFDNLFTHFEREEDIRNLRGKLQDDLVRIHHIMNRATSNSIIIINEIFTSTTFRDALFLSKEIMQKIIKLNLICAWVTFIDEISFCPNTVSMVSTIVPENSNLRTFKIMRRPADGLSYAISIAEKYGLTYDRLRGRISV